MDFRRDAFEKRYRTPQPNLSARVPTVFRANVRFRSIYTVKLNDTRVNQLRIAIVCDCCAISRKTNHTGQFVLLSIRAVITPITVSTLESSLKFVPTIKMIFRWLNSLKTSEARWKTDEGSTKSNYRVRNNI